MFNDSRRHGGAGVQAYGVIENLDSANRWNEVRARDRQRVLAVYDAACANGGMPTCMLVTLEAGPQVYEVEVFLVRNI